MQTLIELYDDRPLENVLGVEMFHPRRVVYVCPADVAENYKIQRKLREYFAHRGEECELFFVRAKIYDTDAMLVCVVDGKIAGNCQISWTNRIKTGHRADVAIALLRDYWNLGIGTKMFEEMINNIKLDVTKIMMCIKKREGYERRNTVRTQQTFLHLPCYNTHHKQ